MMETAESNVDRLARALADAGVGVPDVFVVLGSGLGAFTERLADAAAIPFTKLTSMPASRVPGHAGRFVVGQLEGRRVLAQSGRVHLYEGLSARAVTRSVRAVAALGCRALLLTNAAGAIQASWGTPALMRITDHLNLQGRSPLAGGESGRGNPYDADWGAAIDAEAASVTDVYHTGTYAGLLGPSYESKAEIRWLRSIGADAVGMSTVMEAVAGYASDMRVAGFSCLTNPAAGVVDAALSHDEVVAAGAAIKGPFADLVQRAVRVLPKR